MKWRKQGLIYAPDSSRSWVKKYAYPPVPLFRKDGTLRIYAAFCDENTVGRIGYVDIDASNPSRVLSVSERPVLDIGVPGAFDENGVVPTCILEVGDELYLYYVGYQLGHKVRYYQFQGLAISRDGGETFSRFSRVPVIDRSDAELLNRTSAFVIQENGVFRMWYVAGSEWTHGKDKFLPVYNMRYLESGDGKRWGDEGLVCLDHKSEDEHALGRPWVIRHDGHYRMFYSYRTKSKGYRLGYAESPDGIQWTRKDEEIGIDVSPEGWDSEMVAYASIVPYQDHVYMFYNGNQCGQTGFGYAVLEQW
jgi:predicted GH43/DUF377 family glycosyl hydrolase